MAICIINCLLWPWSFSLKMLADGCGTGYLVLRHGRTFIQMTNWEQIRFHLMSIQPQEEQAAFWLTAGPGFATARCVSKLAKNWVGSYNAPWGLTLQTPMLMQMKEKQHIHSLESVLADLRLSHTKSVISEAQNFFISGQDPTFCLGQCQ
jgi:hypothetical protein